MTSPSPTMDHSANTYLAVFLSQSSPYIRSPSSLSALHPSVHPNGQVGELPDVQLIAIAKSEWDRSSAQIIAALQGGSGITKVEVQQPKTRAKRVNDEF